MLQKKEFYLMRDNFIAKRRRMVSFINLVLLYTIVEKDFCITTEKVAIDVI